MNPSEADTVTGDVRSDHQEVEGSATASQCNGRCHVAQSQRVPLASIDMDNSIQCRYPDVQAERDYAEAMRAGTVFPPIELFGTSEKYWIGDGWHRVHAAQLAQLTEIEAVVHDGGRTEALKHALSANATNGIRRTNEDKKLAVSKALAEFPEFSDHVIADMCAVSHPFVQKWRRKLNPGGNGYHLSQRLGRDGKKYPAHPQSTTPPDAEQDELLDSPLQSPEEDSSCVSDPRGDDMCSDSETPESPDQARDGREREEALARPADASSADASPPSTDELSPAERVAPHNGMHLAQAAIASLEQIANDDPDREQALKHVRRWIDERLG